LVSAGLLVFGESKPLEDSDRCLERTTMENMNIAIPALLCSHRSKSITSIALVFVVWQDHDEQIQSCFQDHPVSF
jgi:hypothetical protein